MEVNSGLVVGSHNQNELMVIRQDGESVQVSGNGSGHICHICEDDVGVNIDGEVFVACDECAFPICKACYEYERSEGSQVCPQCKTRLKRLKGHVRVQGDEEEDDIDDLENELNYSGRRSEQQLATSAAARLPAQISCGAPNSNIPQFGAIHLGMEPYDKNLHPFEQPRFTYPFKLLDAYSYGSIMKNWNGKQERWSEDNSNIWEISKGDVLEPAPLMEGPSRQTLSRKLPISSRQINPCRMIIIIRLVVLGFFFHYRVTHPVYDAYALWLISVICEICFALSWILDQFSKWLPVERETYLDNLSLRYEIEDQPSELSPVDIFVSTVDPLKDPPLVTANTVLSILAVDYPVDRVSCYVSDDGAAMLTFEALLETSEFAKKWVPFCKKYNLEPRAPEWYFSETLDYFNDKVVPPFVKERRAMKREYEEFKVRINSLVVKARMAPEEGRTMQDGSLWPGNDVRDHPGMIQVVLGHDGGHENVDQSELPRLVYVAREKRPGFNNQEKSRAMNALVRVSAVLSNAPYLLKLDCENYINNSKALREAMCFMMDPQLGKRLCYVQFPHGNAKRNTVFCNTRMKGLDGIQGPICVGTGCVFRRQALYGYGAPRKRKPPTRTHGCWCCACGWCSRKTTKDASYRSELERNLKEGDPGTECALKGMEKTFGESPVFVSSTLLEDGGIPTATGAISSSLLKEAIHVASCGYEDKTEWGREVGWMYGSVTEDVLTGFKMHCSGWRSVYCVPATPAFELEGSTGMNLSGRLHQVFRLALGSMEIFFSRHCALWYGYGGGLKWFQRLSYINVMTYPWTSIPLSAYCTLPAVCLVTGKFIIPELGRVGSLCFLSLFLCILATGMLEMRWSGVGIDEWWRNQQFWVIGGVSGHLLAVFHGLLKVLVGVDKNLAVDNWTTLLIPPTTLLILNLIGVVVGVSNAINNGYESLPPLLGKLFFAFWVIVHLYPFLKALLDRQNKTPTIAIVCSILLASIFSLSWVHIDPFLRNPNGPVLEECGLECN